MKRLIVLLAAVACALGLLVPFSTSAFETITFDEPSVTPALDDGTQIGEEFASLGIHFLTDTSSLTDPAIQFFRSTILPPGTDNAIFWYPTIPPAPEDYPYPTTQYLALDKPQGESVTTGVAMQFDAPCTNMSFIYRRPGSNDTTTAITIALFDTSQSDQPFYTTQITAYVFTPDHLDPDHDGWQLFSVDVPAPFDLILFYADKKFAIDNLAFNLGTPPVAGFSASPSSGCAPVNVTFTDESTGATSRLWDFGDGSTSIQQNPTHTYAAPSVYTVSLTATNQYGSDTETKTNYISVNNCPLPSANFSASPRSGGPPPLLVQFTDLSTNVTSWSWSFGDGSTSTQQHPSHQYLAAGTYTVTMTAFNVYGQDTETKTDYITVSVKQPTDFLYFPHIACNNGWETEIAIINADPAQELDGTLKAYDDNGNEVSTLPIALAPHGRREVAVGTEFGSPTLIRYLVLESESSSARGYTKFYKNALYRVAIPAVSDITAGDIQLSHIASNANWWTGIALVNTTDAAKTLIIEFDNGTGRSVTFAPKQHQSFTVESLFTGVSQPDIQSGVITNASGIIGLELFGNAMQLEGIPLTDATTTTLYYPHVASNQTWWTGVVAYNSFSTPISIQVTPYQADGTPLTSADIDLAGKARFFGEATNLGLPSGTAWFKVQAPNNALTGFELFGTRDGAKLAGFSSVGTEGQQGIFAKIEKEGWTGIAFVNTTNEAATVILTAYTDAGTAVASTTQNLAPYQKIVGQAANLFAGQNMSTATYISYTADQQVVGFQLNGSDDGTMLDGLPRM